MKTYFGTDGIRGCVPTELNVSLASRFGFLIGRWVRQQKMQLVTVGHDPRQSSDMLEAAVVSGLCAAGADIERLGVVPTPAVALLTRHHRAGAGIMISASHNSFEYNGIKCFSAKGIKLTKQQEQQIEKQLGGDWPLISDKIGQVQTLSRPAVTEYTDYVAGCVSTDLSGIRVLFDCANGAAAATIPRLIRCLDLNADVIFCSPDGKNINAGCGAVHPQRLGRAVRAGGYQLGIALDGDADRCIAVDETGEVLDGDDLLGILACHWKKTGRLRHDAIATTVLSNRGLEELMRRDGLHIHFSQVGDSHVRELMEQQHCQLGGEPSGHLIVSDYSTTGDGQLTAVCLMQVMVETGKPLSKLRMIKKWPQITRNVILPEDGQTWTAQQLDLRRIEQEAHARLPEGRVLLRCSGTEPIVRILAEGRERERTEQTAALAEKMIYDKIRQSS